MMCRLLHQLVGASGRQESWLEVGWSNNSIIQIYRPASSSRRTNRTRKGEVDRRVGWRLAGVITRSSRYTDPLLLQGELTEQGKEKWTGELAGVITRSSRYTDPLLLQEEPTEQGKEKWTGELAGGWLE